ncbi:hypothetical protein B0O80DRAFT_9626 [Mortierella sp. GBAus27b]|nr:hypothetical protein B0O80DRAFT_9626 [Mortierella sp. GBAus27b]
MKSLLLPFVLAQLAVFSYALPTNVFKIRNPRGFDLQVLAFDVSPWTVAVREPSSSPNQAWQLQPLQDGVIIKLAEGNTRLAFKSTEEGTQVLAIEQTLEGFNSAWRIVDQKTGTYVIQTATQPSACVMSVRDGSIALTHSTAKCQKWRFVPVSTA